MSKKNALCQTFKCLDCDNKIGLGAAVLVDYPDSSLYAGKSYAAYAVKIFKRKTTVLWMDPGKYQFTTTIMPNGFIRKDMDKLDLRPKIVKSLMESINHNSFLKDEKLSTYKQVYKENMEWKEKKQRIHNEERKRLKSTKKRKRASPVQIRSKIKSELFELSRNNSIGLHQIRLATLFVKSKRKRSSELPRSRMEFPKPLSDAAFLRLNSLNILV